MLYKQKVVPKIINGGHDSLQSKKKMRGSFNSFFTTAKWTKCIVKVVFEFELTQVTQPKTQSSEQLTPMIITTKNTDKCFQAPILEFSLFLSIINNEKIYFLKKQMMYIDLGDIMCISTFIQAVSLWDYIKKVFRAPAMLRYMVGIHFFAKRSLCNKSLIIDCIAIIEIRPNITLENSYQC